MKKWTQNMLLARCTPTRAGSGRVAAGRSRLLGEPLASTATKRGWVQHAVQSQWGRYGRINFTGWGTCSKTSLGIHVLITNEFAATGDANGVSGYPWLNGGKYDASGNLTNGVHVDSERHVHRLRDQRALHSRALVARVRTPIGFYHEEERPELTSDRWGTTAPTTTTSRWSWAATTPSRS